MANINSYLENKVIRHYMRVVTFAILGVLLGGVFVSYILFPEKIIVEQSPIAETTEVIATSTEYALPKSYPVQLRIPAINEDIPFGKSLGLNEDKSVQVPESFEEVGYYKYGPTPGELGPAVVLGHVDSYEGPAVFYSLGQLEVGDEIFVDREDGTTATFTVTSLERHKQSGFPTEKVYSNLDHAGLRLITCTGTFDRGIQRYSHNLIVFAELKEDAPESVLPESAE